MQNDDRKIKRIFVWAIVNKEGQFYSCENELVEAREFIRRLDKDWPDEKPFRVKKAELHYV